MRVHNVMTTAVHTCEPESNLAQVAQLMWERDCGLVPVVDSGGRVMGVLTDRDRCIALGTRNVLAAAVSARDVMSAQVLTATASDELGTALATMRTGRIRRLPVLDEHGVLCGMLSLTDVMQHMEKTPKGAKLRDVVAGTMRAISDTQRELSQVAVSG